MDAIIRRTPPAVFGLMVCLGLMVYFPLAFFRTDRIAAAATHTHRPDGPDNPKPVAVVIRYRVIHQGIFTPQIQRVQLQFNARIQDAFAPVVMDRAEQIEIMHTIWSQDPYAFGKSARERGLAFEDLVAAIDASPNQSRRIFPRGVAILAFLPLLCCAIGIVSARPFRTWRAAAIRRHTRHLIALGLCPNCRHPLEGVKDRCHECGHLIDFTA